MAIKLREKYIRDIFDVGIGIKGIDGVLQVIGGIALLLIKPETINRIIVNLSRHELTQDPQDKIANYLLSFSHTTSGSKIFAALFLLSHGLIKILIVIGLLKNKLWAYPTGIIVFTAFGIYQIYRYAHTHSLGMLVLTILDVFVILLTWHEYKVVKANISQR